jgi:HEPN domain-containing protein
MPLDPVRLADTRGWIQKAEMDMRSAQVDLAAVPPLVGDALFHCQQAVEKTLKAFLTWHDHPFRKTHDLVELGVQCAAIDAALEDLLREAAPLTEYAWKFRYPGDASEPTVAEAEVAIDVAFRVIAAVRDRIRADTSP